MSVLIKGMEMPDNCSACPLHDADFCVGDPWCRLLRDNTPNNRRLPGCPLVPLPSHGDLIDKGQLYDYAVEREQAAMRCALDSVSGSDEWRMWNAILNERTIFKFAVADTPVVVPGEDDNDAPN